MKWSIEAKRKHPVQILRLHFYEMWTGNWEKRQAPVQIRWVKS